MVAAFLASSLLALGRQCVGHRGCRSVGKPTWNGGRVFAGFCMFLTPFPSFINIPPLQPPLKTASA